MLWSIAVTRRAPLSGNTPEMLPTRYNLNTELTADVADGPNEFDFQLKSGGEVVQPAD
jgi:hypothetical protein